MHAQLKTMLEMLKVPVLASQEQTTGRSNSDVEEILESLYMDIKGRSTGAIVKMSEVGDAISQAKWSVMQ